MRSAIVNVSMGGWYPRGQKRLVESVNTHAPHMEQLMYTDQLPPNSPTHKDVPYAFKHHAMIEASLRGVDIGVWCDSAVWLIKDPAPMIEKASERGLWIAKAGWTVGHWATDDSLRTLGIDREKAFAIAMAMGTMYAVDLQSCVGKSLLEFMRANEQAMVGPWKNDNGEASPDDRVMGHRHDQVLLSVFCDKMGIPVDDHPTFMAYPMNGEPKPCVVAMAQGM